MLLPAPKPKNQDIQQEKVDSLNFVPEIQNLAQQIHSAYLEKKTEVENRIKAIRKIQSVLDEFKTDVTFHAEEIKASEEKSTGL
jgi:hypothetical protein